MKTADSANGGVTPLLTRRHALAAPLILPATAATATSASDPALAAITRWRRLDAEKEAALSRGLPDDDRDWHAMLACADTVATTPQGLVAQIDFVRESELWDFNSWAENAEFRAWSSLRAGVKMMVESYI